MTLDRDALRQQLIRHEGLKKRPYVDTAGKLTVGIGRNLTDRGLSEAECLYLCDNDIDAAVRALTTYAWFADLDPVRQAVLVNMMFNLGALRFTGFRRLIDAGEHHQYSLAADEMLDSVWAQQVGDRAVELAAQMRTGAWQV